MACTSASSANYFWSCWEVWQICASLAVGKKCDWLTREAPVLFHPLKHNLNAVTVMQIKNCLNFPLWPNFLMNDSRLIVHLSSYVLLCVCRKHSEQEMKTHLVLLLFLLLPGVKYAVIKWCSWSVATSLKLFLSSDLAEVTIHTAYCKII